MSREIDDAVARVTTASTSLLAIAQLPQGIGVTVVWPHNGVIWTRAGDDDWRASEFPDEPTQSAHIASCKWVLVPNG